MFVKNISMADKNINPFTYICYANYNVWKKDSYRLIFATTVQETFAGENKKKRWNEALSLDYHLSPWFELNLRQAALAPNHDEERRNGPKTPVTLNISFSCELMIF